MEENSNIEFFTEDETKKEKSNKNKTYILILSVFVMSVISLMSLSFLSVTSVKKCALTAKDEASSFATFEREIMQKSNLNYISVLPVSEEMFFNKCVKSNFLAQNAKIIISSTINYLGVLFLISIYLIFFKKNKKIISFGKAIIVSTVIVFASMLGQLLGLAGLIVSTIITYATVKKVIGTDIFGAIIFVTIIGLLNWVLLSFIVKMFL